MLSVTSVYTPASRLTNSNSLLIDFDIPSKKSANLSRMYSKIVSPQHLPILLICSAEYPFKDRALVPPTLRECVSTFLTTAATNDAGIGTIDLKYTHAETHTAGTATTECVSQTPGCKLPHLEDSVNVGILPPSHKKDTSPEDVVNMGCDLMQYFDENDELFPAIDPFDDKEYDAEQADFVMDMESVMDLFDESDHKTDD